MEKRFEKQCSTFSICNDLLQYKITRRSIASAGNLLAIVGLLVLVVLVLLIFVLILLILVLLVSILIVHHEFLQIIFTDLPQRYLAQ